MNVMVALIWQFVEETFGKATCKSSDTTSTTNSQLPHKLLLATSFCYVVAMTCSNEAIPRVSYPVAVLAKSCKLLPTMLVGQLVERKAYSRSEWTAAVCISVGICLFHSARWKTAVNNKTGRATRSESMDHDYYVGMILLLVSLLCDGILGSCQNWIKRSGNNPLTKTKPPSAAQTMLYVNLYALLFLTPLAVLNGQLHAFILQRIFLSEPILAWNLLLLNTTSAIGQIFIFCTITWYTPVLCTTITTTRKFLTILLSVYWFGHAFAIRQWVGIALVFGGLYTVILCQHQQHQERQKEEVGDSLVDDDDKQKAE
jgi:UDP-galactose transporter B1